MLRFCTFLWLLPVFLFAQESTQECMLISTATPKPSNFVLPKKTYKSSSNELKSIEDYLSSSSIVQGYKYHFNLKNLDQIFPFSDLKNVLPIQHFSFLESNLLNSINSDLNIKGSVNLNGITNLMTLKGKLNKYDGNYLLQVSYHISSNNTRYIPKIVNERYQKGLALIFKMNLGR